MSGRELHVLGTSSQVPTRYRNHNGYLLRWDGTGVLFDPGEGTQRQLTTSDLPVSAIHHICITHFHGDHCLGLPGIVQRLSLDGVSHEVPVYFPASGGEYFERLRHASIFHDVANVVPRPITRAGDLCENAGFTLSASRLSHSVESWGFRLQERDGRRMLPRALERFGVRGPAISRLLDEGALRVGDRTVRIEDVSEARPGQSFAFVMDTRICDAAYELARDADLLVCESTYLSSEAALAQEAGHMTAQQAASLARDAGVRRLVLTHFSQRHRDESAFLDEALPIHADTVAARDGDVIAVPKRS